MQVNKKCHGNCRVATETRNKLHVDATGIIFAHLYKSHRALDRKFRAVMIVASPSGNRYNCNNNSNYNNDGLSERISFITVA